MSHKKFNLSVNKKINSYNKTIKVDSDKSISIRSFIIGSISENITTINNVLESEDVFASVNCLKKLGIKITKIKKKYLVYGKGLGSLQINKNGKLNFGNSGTLARLLIGVLSTTPNIKVNISGDHSLNKRSMKKLIDLMRKFGASFYPKNKYKFPIKLISSKFPMGIFYKAGVSAQLKSAVMLAGLNSYGNTTIAETQKSRDHTENILLNSKKTIFINNDKQRIIKIFGKNSLNSLKINVPCDPSSAAFFSALTLLNEKSKLKIKGVGLNKTRIGFYELLQSQGAKIKFKNIKKINNEICGDIIVKSCKLKPILATKNYYTSMTDEYPILFIMAALIKGTSVFRGIKDLANKESNRILEIKKILDQINIKTKIKKNEFIVYGKGLVNASKKKVKVPNLGDHRICMSAFVLTLLTGANTKINNFETVFTSAPSFLKIMKTLGAKFEIQY